MRALFSRLKGNVFPTILGFIFFFVGAALLSVSIKTYIDTSHYPSAIATVISSKVYYDGDGDLMVISTYEYYVDGERYTGTLGAETANSAKLEGATFKIRYNPDDPANSTGRSYMIIVILLFGLTFACIGGGVVIAVFSGKLK